jgi:hypothetical protein
MCILIFNQTLCAYTMHPHPYLLHGEEYFNVMHAECI